MMKKGGSRVSYKALYRVWRPQKLEDISGQTHITKTLQNALVQEKFSHAYLFTGPRGTGKTSAAKIIARAINCEKAPVREPCNECRACRGILDGTVVDVVEMDAASNNGVDEIRYIRDNVMAAPRDLRYKVYIIDEVHMLSTGAFNALLKTLEEPPKHAIFILATTEPHKIPLTIVSRCQRFDFKRISPSDLVARMTYILEREGWKAEEEALHLIARTAEGGMRDALSLLDQAISFAEETITVDDVLAITGTVSERFLRKVATALKERDSVSAITFVHEAIQNGKDPLQFIEDLMYYFRDVLLYKTSPSLDKVFHRATNDEDFQQFAEEIEEAWVYEVIHALNQYQQQMKTTPHRKVFLEMAFIHICKQEKSPSSQVVEALERKIEQLEKKLLAQNDAPSSPTTADRARAKPEKTARARPTQAPVLREEKARLQGLLDEASKQDLEWIVERWNQIRQEVKKKSVPAHAWLSDSQPVVSDGKRVLLAFQNDMHRNMVEKKFRPLIQEAMTVVCGQPVEFLTTLAPHWEKLKQAYKERHASDDTPREESDPVVEEAVKLFGSEIVEVIEDK